MRHMAVNRLKCTLFSVGKESLAKIHSDKSLCLNKYLYLIVVKAAAAAICFIRALGSQLFQNRRAG